MRRMPGWENPANSASTVSQDNPLGPDRLDRVIQPDEEPLEIVFTRLLDLMPIDADIVDNDLALRDERRQIEAERGHIGGQVLDAFLEGHEHAALTKLGGAADEELRGQERLPGPSSAAD